MDLVTGYPFLYGLTLIGAGYFITLLSNVIICRAISWSVAVITVFFSAWITTGQPALFRMISIVTLQLFAMKIIVLSESYRQNNRLSFLQWCAFALGYFGMRPALFENLPSKSILSNQLLVKGFSRIIAGMILLYLSRTNENYLRQIFFLPELLLLIGLSLVLHFGILNLTTAFWQFFGVPAKELFRSPYKSKSLKEFWGRRWNMAFSEMTSIVAYIPLKNRIGVNAAIFISFLLSGLLHEIAITLPTKSCYDLPMCYFLIHGILMYLESKPIIRMITEHRILSHVWVLGWLVVPMPLLFNNDFVAQVLQPLRENILLHYFASTR